MVPLFGQNNNREQFPEAGDGRVRYIFQGVADPRRGNATTRDLVEMLMITLLATLTGWSRKARSFRDTSGRP